MPKYPLHWFLDNELNYVGSWHDSTNTVFLSSQDEGKDKALRSSQAFFSELQDQVKSQIKSAKDQSSKKKKHKEISVSKLKL